MVDAEDLKSFGHCDRVGSSPTIPTTKFSNKFMRVENLSATPQRCTYCVAGLTISGEGGQDVHISLDVWLSWLEHYVHIVGVGGSSPPTSTTIKNAQSGIFCCISVCPDENRAVRNKHALRAQ